MSGENVEIVRRAYAAVGPRDLVTLDSVWSDECEFRSVFAASEGTVFRGRQGIRDFFTAVDEAFDHFWIEPQELVDAGADRVVAVANITARGKGSGIPLEQRVGQLWTLQRGKVYRLESWTDPPEAFRVAGVAE